MHSNTSFDVPQRTTGPVPDPWRITARAFPAGGSMEEKIKFFLGFAILAPSTHNTQPWHFTIRGNEVVCALVPSRVLPASDPDAREAYVSMGACAENFIIAAAAAGYGTTLTLAQELPVHPHTASAPVPVCRITLTPVSNAGPSALLYDDAAALCKAIPLRQSARVPYAPEPLPQEIQKHMGALAQPGAGPDAGVHLHILETPEQKQHAAEAVAQGTIAAFKNPAFGKELSQWLHPNSSREKLCMPGHTFGLPGIVSHLLPKILARFNVGKGQARMMKKVILESPALCVVAGAHDTPPAWFAAGRVAQRCMLAAAAAGLGTALFGAPVEFTPIAQAFAAAAGIPGRPLVFFRIGRPLKPVSFAPRLSVQECM